MPQDINLFNVLCRKHRTREWHILTDKVKLVCLTCRAEQPHIKQVATSAHR